MSLGAGKTAGFFGLERATPPDFYRSDAELKEAAGRMPYAHQMRKAWEELGLDGIYCIERVPTVYFKSTPQISAHLIRDLHAKLWNHGIATVLALVSPTEVVVLSALAYPARSAEEVLLGYRVVERINLVTEAFRARNLISDLNSGRLYQEHEKSFREENSIDRYLLKNLGAARDELLDAGGMSIGTVHALLGQLIFVCYLADRKIINGRRFELAGAPGVDTIQEFFSQPNLTAKAAQETLKALLAGLQTDFHGSLFGQPTITRVDLNRRHLDVLRRFFRAEEIGAEQLSLNFWAYDFGVIPVETISSIYEDFLGAEGADSKRSAGAFYTPKHLAELTVDQALGAGTSLLDKRVLDPSCGSGIFLVIAFNRMAEELRARSPRQWNITRAKALQELLTTKLCGVDASETACNIACFGLYLALLDQLKPRDVNELREHHQFILPELLRKDTSISIYAGVIHSDFFSTKLNFSEKFDLVLGNPPWVGRDAAATPVAQEWCKKHAASTKSLNYRDMVPQNQSAHAFMWKVPTHLSPDGEACMLLPTKVLLNRTDAFQKAWLARHRLDEVLMLADYRFVLFEDAKCPSMIMKFRTGNPPESQTVDYIVPKVDTHDPRRGVIHVAAEDRKFVRVNEVLQSAANSDATVLWKKLLWGSPRDLQLLNRLSNLPQLSCIVGSPASRKRWIKGQGFQPMSPSAESPRPTWWTKDWPFISAKASPIHLVLLSDECEPVGFEHQVVRRLPAKSIFSGPKVLVTQGFTKVAFCEFDALFQDSIQSIAGPEADRELLCFLTAVLRSPLARYFHFHTAANWGTERNKVHLFELLRMPFPLPNDTFDPENSAAVVKRSAEIIADLTNRIRSQPLLRDQYVADADDELNELVYRYYDIGADERKLIRDTVHVWEPSSTPHTIHTPIPTREFPSVALRSSYAKLLTEHLNSWADGSVFCVSSRGSINSELGIGILVLEKSKRCEAYCEFQFNELLEALSRLESVTRQWHGALWQHKNLKVFNGNELFIMKPLMTRFWTATAALNDADEIAHAILCNGG